jgi:UDP-N-acetylmuramoylalanine--D-glutamate ligase
VAGTDNPDLTSKLAAIVGETGATLLTMPGRRGYSLTVPGAHNQANAACAATVCEALGVSDENTRDSLASFAGLPHRLEHVGTHRGVDYYNDSKSTTPQAVVTAVNAFDRPLVVLVGGHDKGLPLETMAGVLVKRAAAVACFGAAGDRLVASLRAVRGSDDAPVIHRVDRMSDAVTWARSIANAGDVVLLSPGCSSFDEFANYEYRGRAFAEQVRAAMKG